MYLYSVQFHNNITGIHGTYSIADKINAVHEIRLLCVLENIV